MAQANLFAQAQGLGNLNLFGTKIGPAADLAKATPTLATVAQASTPAMTASYGVSNQTLANNTFTGGAQSAALLPKVESAVKDANAVAGLPSLGAGLYDSKPTGGYKAPTQGQEGPGGAKFGGGAGGDNRFDYKVKGSGLWSMGIDPADPNAAVTAKSTIQNAFKDSNKDVWADILEGASTAGVNRFALEEAAKTGDFSKLDPSQLLDVLDYKGKGIGKEVTEEARGLSLNDISGPLALAGFVAALPTIGSVLGTLGSALNTGASAATGGIANALGNAVPGLSTGVTTPMGGAALIGSGQAAPLLGVMGGGSVASIGAGATAGLVNAGGSLLGNLSSVPTSPAQALGGSGSAASSGGTTATTVANTAAASPGGTAGVLQSAGAALGGTGATGAASAAASSSGGIKGILESLFGSSGAGFLGSAGSTIVEGLLNVFEGKATADQVDDLQDTLSAYANMGGSPALAKYAEDRLVQLDSNPDSVINSQAYMQQKSALSDEITRSLVAQGHNPGENGFGARVLAESMDKYRLDYINQQKNFYLNLIQTTGAKGNTALSGLANAGAMNNGAGTTLGGYGQIAQGIGQSFFPNSSSTAGGSDETRKALQAYIAATLGA